MTSSCTVQVGVHVQPIEVQHTLATPIALFSGHTENMVYELLSSYMFYSGAASVINMVNLNIYLKYSLKRALIPIGKLQYEVPSITGF